MYMDMNSGTWLNLPFGPGIDDITDYEIAVMKAAEIARKVWYVWGKADENRTASDYEFMQWANKS